MESIVWSSKIFPFCVTLSPILCQVSMEAVTKDLASLILSRSGPTCYKHDKSPSSRWKSFACVLHTCSKFSLVKYPILQTFNRIKPPCAISSDSATRRLNVSHSQSICGIWLIIGISHLPNFPFLLFSSSQNVQLE